MNIFKTKVTPLVFFIVAYVFLAGANAHAITAILRFVDSSPKSELNVGSPIDLEILLEGNDGTSWTIDTTSTEKWIKQGPILIDFHSLGSPEERKSKIHLKAVVAQSGQATIPPVILRAEGQSQKIETNMLSLSAKNQLKPNQEEVAWLLPPLPFGSWNLFVIYGILLLSILLGVGLGVFLYRNFFGKRSAKERSALELFNDEIQQAYGLLNGKHELNLGDCKKLSFALSAALRRFYSQAYNHNFLDLTDSEVNLKAAELGVLPERRRELAAILEGISEVRYSKKILASGPAQDLLKRSLDLAKTIQNEKDLANQSKQKGRDG